MIQSPEYLAQLIKKLFDESISEDEKIILNTWMEENPSRKLFIEDLNQNDQLFEEALKWIELENQDQEVWTEKLSRITFNKISQWENSNKIIEKKKSKWAWYAAASILIGLTFSLLWLNQQSEDLKIKNKIALEHILPGKYQAALTLPNGEKIALSEKHDLLKISKDQTLSYGSGEPILSLKNNFKEEDKLIIEIPRAGHYRLELADGSLVWLNSETKLSFPISFQENRKVELSGEGYFHVKSIKDHKNNKQGFWVRTNDQLVEVTGTEFNVYNFPKEDTKTTLVEGNVNIHSSFQSISLKKDEQSRLTNGSLKKSRIDVSTEIAWKDNMFYFDETTLQDAMRLLGRWYNLEIVYKKDIPETFFYGKFSRDQPLQDLLKILEEAGVKFDFEVKDNQNCLIVLPQEPSQL